MIKQFGDYDKVKGYSDSQRLPKGGYVLKVLAADIKQGSYGDYLEVNFDIEEGDFYHYYANDYKAQQNEDKKWRGKYLLNVPKDDGSEADSWAKRRFKTFTTALEDSNPGYHFDWDEAKFKGKLFGGLFHEREFEKQDGTVGTFVTVGGVCSVDKIRSGDYKLPKDKALKTTNTQPTYVYGQSGSDFMTIPEGADNELPFA